MFYEYSPVMAQLICVFVFLYAKRMCSHDTAHFRLFAIGSQLSPETRSSGIEMLETDTFKLHCHQTMTGNWVESVFWIFNLHTPYHNVRYNFTEFSFSENQLHVSTCINSFQI